jgi:hypothetical protein
VGRATHDPETEDAEEPDASTATAGTKDSVAPDAGVYTTGDPAYREGDCDKLADVSPIEKAYLPGGRRAAAEALATARYPTGLPFLKVQDDAALGTWFRGAPDTFEGVASRFDAAVHEGSHIWGTKRFDLRTVTYPVRGDLTIQTRRLANFDRSAIVTRHVDPAGDSYVKIYLEGKSGAEGFNSLLDEYNAYAHSLAASYCTRDLLRPGTRVSALDGILTMRYYVETYLALARTAHPADYAAILADPGHVRMILTVWDRAELWLRRSVGVRELGIDVERLTARVYEPARLEEIAVVREKAKATHAR